MTPARRATVRRLLRVVGTVALLAVTAWWVGVDAVLGELRTARPLPLAVALGLSFPLMLALAGRWSFTARRMGLDLPLSVAISEYYASTLLNQVLPGGILGDVGRAVRGGARNPKAKGAAARSVVLERVSGQVALWVLVGVGASIWGADEGLRFVLALGGVAVVVALALGIATRLPGFADSRLGRGWSAFVREARQSFLERGAWAVQLGLSVVSILVLMAMYGACAQAVGAQARLSQLVFIAPVLLAVTSLPVSVGGWGVREVASAALFEMTGLEPTLGVAASAAFGAVNLLAALPGAIGLLRRPPT